MDEIDRSTILWKILCASVLTQLMLLFCSDPQSGAKAVLDENRLAKQKLLCSFQQAAALSLWFSEHLAASSQSLVAPQECP